MKVKVVHNSDEAYEILKDRSRYDYTYQFNNLSKEYWENVICYGLVEKSKLKEIAMMNINYGIPVLLAANHGNENYNTDLLSRIKELLPTKFYTHIDKVTLDSVFSDCKITEKQEYINMGLCDYEIMNGKNPSEALRLGISEIADIKELLSVSYPEAWLDDDLVKLGENFGIYVDNKLISFAGIHAYSEEYQVTAVAHVTTHPDFRRKGYGEKAVAPLLKSLKDKIKYIGLNVKVDNLPAINCYKKLGFREFGRFTACMVEKI